MMSPERRGREPDRHNPAFDFDAEYENDDGYSVPEAYRKHRDEYDERPEDLESFRKQLMYRCGRFGTKEIEIILTDWFKEHAAGLSYNELKQFDIDVLNMENPQMIRYLLSGEPLDGQHDNKFMRIIVEYVNKRKGGAPGRKA